MYAREEARGKENEDREREIVGERERKREKVGDRK